MTSELAYEKFLLRINKNDTNTNIKVPKSQFVIIFNEEKRVWLSEIIKAKEALDYIDDIEELLVLDKLLVKDSSTRLSDNFNLPTDFYRRATAYAVTSKDKCTDNVITVWFIKPKNKDIYLQNSNLSPSFEYQETIAIINNSKISIFKGDFKIDEAYLNYYKEPLDIDLSGYIKIDGTNSSTINTELSDENMEQIIKLTALQALKNYQDTEAAQLAAT